MILLSIVLSLTLGVVTWYILANNARVGRLEAESKTAFFHLKDHVDLLLYGAKRVHGDNRFRNNANIRNNTEKHQAAAHDELLKIHDQQGADG